MKDLLCKKIATMSEDALFSAIYKDNLTGLLNRRAFDEVGSTSSNYLAIVDADSLKWVNDNMGYRVGDSHLCQIASSLVEVFEECNVYRIAGDEFVITFADPIWAKALLELVRVGTPGFSFGIGRGLVQANDKLKLDKVKRTQLGLRVERGLAPFWSRKFNHG